MGNNQLIDQFEQLQQLFRTQLKKSRKKNTAPILHDLRVAYKQLDAFHLWCLTFMQPNDAILLETWFSKLRPIYKKAGKTRTIHLFIKDGTRLGLWQILPQIEKMLLQLQDERKETFSHFLSKYRYPTAKKTYTALQKYNSINKSQLNNICIDLTQRHRKEATTCLQTPPGEQWHEARRLIKANYFLMQNFHHPSNTHNPNQELEIWRDMEQLLGKWHDLILLKQFIKNNSEPEVLSLPILDQQIKTLETNIALATQKL